MLHVALPVLLAALLPTLFTAIAKAGAFSPQDNHETRNWQTKLTGWRQRAHWAHLNSFEAFPSFAAGVILAHVAAPGNTAAHALAWAFVVLRLLYGVWYLTDKASLRSLTWMAASGCSIALFVIALKA